MKDTVKSIGWVLALACVAGAGVSLKFGWHLVQAVILLGVAVLLVGILTKGGRE